MRRIDDDDNRATYTIEDNRRSWVWPTLGAVVCLGALYWVWNHISGGCTDFASVLTYCQGHSGSVIITK